MTIDPNFDHRITVADAVKMTKKYRHSLLNTLPILGGFKGGAVNKKIINEI